MIHLGPLQIAILFASLMLTAAVARLAWVRLNTLLSYFQQEEYDGGRFLGAVRRVRLYDVKASLVLLALMIATAVSVLAGMTLWWIATGMVLAAAVIVWLAQREASYRYKKPLVLTERARRIRKIAALIAAFPILCTIVGSLPALIAIQILPLTLVIANALLKPGQERINRDYIEEAGAKLERMNPVRIGITGSFGKTTTKHIFAEVLAVSGPVFYSRGSINTVLGLTRHIRERLQWSHRYFIAEMGAYGIGSVRRLCDFVHPDYGIVTAIGEAHTERFGSVDNIAKAKSELVEDVCENGGTAIVSTQVLDYAPFRDLRARYDGQVVSVGPEEDADIRIVSAALDQADWKIVLIDRRDGAGGATLEYELPLLGEHNVTNSALAVAAAWIIDPSIANRIPLVTPDVEQVPHRLQKRESPGEALVLDDAYNANEAGFRNAVAVAADLARQRGGRAIVVTPGIAELGLEHDRVHAALGEYTAGLADMVYAVNPSRIGSFTKALVTNGKPPIEVASFADARDALRAEARPEDVILYENDLPDLLEERRLL
ncbi:UDP-N-acetylmuramoyl-tripeptide--D-alanyl-D-alanine ligase [Croceicoccus ponticola]|uniref:UDP-N-acetylmuramoyl-tripeptide--D-alanyl-D-alanine ligase n=1 Tax=Croceicoccus ponticola TaxID=2217664 RepID=A0A437H0W7_9SPHN|nr:UDP-N-acetylmuramoyl-tripeptide--D-alanyl-D-alanine ligase [Croceicoccus ponticola]RVQ69280.1 UDP-N-acetylmuramoyl-tripeptide--D-alanyl-D-alanine ligase [Croceicoccus ponticola]